MIPCSLLSSNDHVLYLLDDVGLNSLGRFIKQDNFRVGQHRAGNGELLLLAAREIATAAIEEFLQHREQVEHLVFEYAGVAGVAARESAQFQISRVP